MMPYLHYMIPVIPFRLCLLVRITEEVCALKQLLYLHKADTECASNQCLCNLISEWVHTVSFLSFRNRVTTPLWWSVLEKTSCESTTPQITPQDPGNWDARIDNITSGYRERWGKWMMGTVTKIKLFLKVKFWTRPSDSFHIRYCFCFFVHWFSALS